MLAAGLINLGGFWTALRSYPWWQVTLELLFIGVVVFWVVRFLQGTRGARMVRGIVLLLLGLYLVVELLGGVLDLGRIQYLYNGFLIIATFAIVVVFQPELRRALMRLGETRWFRQSMSQLGEQVDELVECALFCSRRKIGALIAVERDVGLRGIAESGQKVDAEVSAALLSTIFWPNSPLHDLGVIISQGRVSYAGVQFPLSESDDLEKELGSRHRAALGMSQETDAVVLIVSEETGDISVAERGVLMRKLNPEAVRDLLSELLGSRSSTAPAASEDE